MIDDDLLRTIREASQERKADIKAHGKRTEWRITAAIILMFVGVLVYEYIDSRLPNPPGLALVSIQQVQPADPPQLCPGDLLEYTYNVDGAADGVVDINVTTYRKTPPARTIIYSEPLHDILVNPVHQEAYAVWEIPAEVTDPFTGETIALLPGEYERRISISTPSRNTQPAIATIDFVIREDCPKRGAYVRPGTCEHCSLRDYARRYWLFALQG